MSEQNAGRDITHLVEGKVIFLLAFVAVVQTLYPITAYGRLATIVYQVFYAGLLVTGVLLARDTPFHARALAVLGIVWLAAVLLFDFNQTAVSIPDAIAQADTVLFAIPGRAVGETAVQLGSQLNGKILLDATNNVGQQPMNNLGVLRQAAPHSPLFRAFSTLGWENFAEPVIDGQQVDLFYCGDAGEGQTAVDQLIRDIGLRPVYLGGVEQVELVDALTRLWFVLAFQQGKGRRLAFKAIGV